MKEVFNKRTALILLNAGVILIVIGLILEISVLASKIKDQEELIDIQATQIIQCNEEENALYGEYLKLEEENMALWNNYYMNVTNKEGYEYYE